MQSWIARDPEAALAAIRQIPPGNERSQSLLLLLDTIGRTNPDRALALAAELIATRDERSFYSSIFDRLARETISAAIPRLAAVPAGEARDNALRALTDAWVRLNYTAAGAWAKDLPAPADRSLALEIIFLDLAPRDPLHAIELAQKSLAGPALDRVVLGALQTLTKTDPRGASEFVSLLPPGELQTQAAMDVARAFAAQSPEAAVAWALTLPAGNPQILALNNALASWTARDPTAAAQAVLSLPPGRTQHTAAVAFATLFGLRDPPAALAWAQSLPPTDTRPVALTNIASAWAQRDPAAASRWTAAQTDLPPAALRGAMSYWLLLDAPAARAWLDTANLPAETKARLRGP